MAKVMVEKRPDWLLPLDESLIQSQDHRKIVDFFVLKTPCYDLSMRAITLPEYGWNTPWKKPYHLNRQLKQAASHFDILFSSSSYDGMEDALRKASLLERFPNNLQNERICIYDCQKNQFMSVFYHLRNGLAHGRFNIQKEPDGALTYVLEDVSGRSDPVKVSARMVIRQSTLLNWIGLITGGSREYQNRKVKS